MDFGLSPRAQEAERRAADMLAAEGAAVASPPAVAAGAVAFGTTAIVGAVASRRPAEPPISSGLPVTTDVTVWRWCME
mgnify:CR=1 FL=1